MQPERAIERQVITYLRLRGWLAIKVRTSGRMVNGRMLALPRDELGVSDIVACSPDGRFHAIEVKTKTGRQSENQRRFQKAVLMAGGIYTVLRSLEDAVDYVAALEKKMKKT